MRVLLINPPCDQKTIGLRHIAKIEPLGLELIGAAIKDKYEVKLVDMEVAPKDLLKTLKSYKPDIVGVTSEIVHRDTALEALKLAKKMYPDCLTVVGGHHATMQPEDFCNSVVNLIVIGEGVISFGEICDTRAKGGTNYEDIKGIAIVYDGKKIQRTPPRALPTTLDDYPMPDRTLTSKYRNKYYYLFEKSVAAVRTSFGCTHHCIFCSVRVYSSGQFICRSAKSVFEEIKSLKEPFVMFCDDHSFINPERMRNLAQMLIDAKVQKRYFVYARTDSIVQHKDVFKLWAQAGLKLVMAGLEALDDEALKKSGKRVDIETNEKALKIAEECGFFLSAGFLVDPNFGREDFEKIDRYVTKRPSILLTEYTPLTPFPGTPLYRNISNQLLTHKPYLFDLQHFVLPTRLPAKELYKLQFEYYKRSTKRVLKYLFNNNPKLLASSHMAKLLWGLLQNSKAYKRAYLDIPDKRMAMNHKTINSQVI